MGLAFPMTEVISNHVPSFSYLVWDTLSVDLPRIPVTCLIDTFFNYVHVFFICCFSEQGFYLYLYFCSIAYFFFVFFNMLKNRAAKGNRYFGELFDIWIFYCVVCGSQAFRLACCDSVYKTMSRWRLLCTPLTPRLIMARAHRPVPLYNV